MIIYQNDPRAQREADPYKRSTKAGKQQPTPLPLQTKEGRTSESSAVFAPHMLANKRVPSEDAYFSPVLGCGVLRGKMDAWCALKRLLGLGGPAVRVRID